MVTPNGKKKWLVTYDHKDGRAGTVEVMTEVSDSGAFAYGNRKAGALWVERQMFGYDLRYCKGDLHRVMLDEFFGAGLVKAEEVTDNG